MTCYGNFDAGCLMPPIETETPAQALAAARRAIDGAMTRDRGQLHGLWSRWQARPADAALRQRFEQSLAQSCARREARRGSPCGLGGGRHDHDVRDRAPGIRQNCGNLNAVFT